MHQLTQKTALACLKMEFYKIYAFKSKDKIKTTTHIRE
jgi:hypothetical protein